MKDSKRAQWFGRLLLSLALVVIGVLIGNALNNWHHQNKALTEYSTSNIKPVEKLSTAQLEEMGKEIYHLKAKAKELITRSDERSGSQAIASSLEEMGRAMSQCMSHMRDMLGDPKMRKNPEHEQHIHQMYGHMQSMRKNYESLLGRFQQLQKAGGHRK